MISVIALDVKNRPNEIPTSRWLELHKEYTIIKLMKMKIQGGIAGVKLAEINNDDLWPWTYFRADRFGITEDELNRLAEINELEVEYV